MTEPQQPKPPTNAPVVVSEQQQPCGCVLTTYSNGMKNVSPCPPCGIRDAAHALIKAGQILIATAGTIARLNAPPPPPDLRVVPR